MRAGEPGGAAEPTVAAVIPVYNGAAFVADAIESVLAQTHPVAECLVVDDGSTDATAEVVRRFDERVRLLQQANAGVATARNRGAGASSSRYVAFLDADDTWQPGKIERQLVAAGAAAGRALVLCDLELFDETGAVIGHERMTPGPDTLRDMVLFEGVATVSCSSTALLERSLFDQLGGFDQQLSQSADWDFLARAWLAAEVVSLPEPLVRYRVHGANMSRNVALLERDMRYAFGKLFARDDLPDDVRACRRRAEANLHRMLAGSYFRQRAMKGFVRATARSIARDPSALRWYAGFPLRRVRARRGAQPGTVRRSASSPSAPTDSSP